MKVFRETFTVKSYETDMNAMLKPCSFMYHLQEMANMHAASLGFGYDDLIEKGILWVLSRIHVKFNRMPAWREEVTMETWHKGSEKLFGLRDYKMEDLAGNRLAEVTSSWLIIGTESRRLQRIEQHLGNDTAFTGSTAYNVIVGDSGSTNRYLTTTDKTSAGRTALVPTGYIGTGENIRLTVTPTVATATAGKITLRVNYMVANRANEVQIT